MNNPNINVAALFPENFRCIISGPSECGKTLLLKNLILNGVDFDKLYIIGPTDNQYNDLEFDDVVFIKDIKELPSPDKLPKNIKKLVIFDDVDPREQIIKEYFCRCRHSNCNMISLNQNLFSLDRQNVRIVLYLFYLSKGVMYSNQYIETCLMIFNLIIKILVKYVIRYRESLIITLSLI